MTLDHHLSFRGRVPDAAGSAAVAAAVVRRFSLGLIAYEVLLAALTGSPVYVGCAAAAGAAYMLGTQWAMRVADRNDLARAGDGSPFQRRLTVREA